MIIIVQNGRLGNQAFQYLALRNLFDEHLVLVGFSGLEKLFNPSNFNAVTFFPLQSVVLRSLFIKAIRVLAHLKLITLYREFNTPQKYEIRKQNGLLKWPSFFDIADFQHPVNTSKIPFSLISLRKSLENKALDRINLLKKKYPLHTLVFVHIRRGDYVRWPTLDTPAILPLKWYLKAMNIVKKSIEKPIFLILTDDIPYAQDVFDGKPDVVIENNDEFLDIAIMSSCSCGILSASSFSWLGAYLAYSKNIQAKTLQDSLFLAPTPWMIEQSCHIPPNMHTSWLSLVPRGLDKC